jgi:cell division protein FtsQ
MNRTAQPPPARAAAGGTWRDIRQEMPLDAITRAGRRRQVGRWLKFSLGCCGVALAAWGAYEAAHRWTTDRTAVTKAVRSPAVRQVTVVTDPGGVLSTVWVRGVLDLPPAASLLALDLAALRERLLAFGQVRGVELALVFPDTLAVTLQERTPVARVQAVDAQGIPRPLLVAKDGVVYEGIAYDPAMLATLPHLDGVRLVPAGRGLRPIEGMAVVADLLTNAQLQAPHLYRDWQVVSLARLAEHDEIVIRSREIPEIVFSRREGFFRQLARLDYVTDRVRERLGAAPTSVNLALGSQVPTTMPPAAESLRSPSSSSNPRKNFRDL